MTFSELAKYLQRLEETSKRLEITAILSELIENLSAEETDKAIYLSLGTLKAPFESETFNLADKMMMKALEKAYDTTAEKVQSLYDTTGDLGDVAYSLNTNEESKDLSILQVHRELMDIAQAAGSGSQETKIKKLSDLLVELDRFSSKYTVRIILGTTRLGFTELTILDALSQYIQGDKLLKTKIQEKYNQHPDIGLIAKKIKENGIEGIEYIEMEVGVPIMPQLAQRLSDPKDIVEKMGGKVWAEFKLDGTRVQLHFDRNKTPEPANKGSGARSDTEQQALFEDTQPKVFVKTFTRNLEETTAQFPDLVEAATQQIQADSVILDGEAIGYDRATGEFLPFQESIKRKRKHSVTETTLEIPMKYFVFDILFLNGKSLMEKTLTERRKILISVIEGSEIAESTIQVADHLETEDPKTLEEYFEESKSRGLEGLVIKNPDTAYQAGARSYAWVKLKKAATDLLEDDFDCVILGYNFGKGVRSEFGIGGFLVGIYDAQEDKFKTITKIGTGLKENDWKELKDRVDKIRVKEQPANVEVKKQLYPSVWATPRIVVRVKADEITKSPMHTAEYALRFPRFMGFRDDKRPQDATALEELKSLYNSQKRGYY